MDTADEVRKRRKEARRAERKARKQRNEAQSSRPVATQHAPKPPQLVEEDITELPYAASQSFAPPEYDIGQIVHPHSLPSRTPLDPPIVRHAPLLRPSSNEEQDLADVSVTEHDAIRPDTLQARPRSRKDGIGEEGWKDRMQQWTQTVPTNDGGMINSSVSADVVPDVVQPLPGAPPLVVNVPDVVTSATPSEDVKPESPPMESAMVRDLVDMPMDLPKDPFVPPIDVNDGALRPNLDQPVGQDELSKERNRGDSGRKPKSDRETNPNPRIDAHTRHEPGPRKLSPPVDELSSAEIPPDKEEPTHQDTLYGQFMHDDILEDTSRNRSIAENGRPSHRDHSHEVTLVEKSSKGFTDGSMGLPLKAEKKRRKEQNTTRNTTDSQPLTQPVDQPQSPSSASPAPRDQPPEIINQPLIDEHQFDHPGDLFGHHSPVYRTEAPSSADDASEETQTSMKKRSTRAGPSERAKRRQRSAGGVDQSGSPSPPATIQSPEGTDVDANVQKDLNENESEGPDRRGSSSAKGESGKTPKSRSMKDRLKRVKEKVTGKKKRKGQGAEEETRALSTNHDDDHASEPSSATESIKPVSGKGKGKDHRRASETIPTPSTPRETGMDTPSAKGKPLQVGGFAVDPSMVGGVVLLGVAVFRGASGSSSSSPEVSISDTDTDTDPTATSSTSIYILGGVIVLVVVVLLGVWKGTFQKIPSYDKNSHRGTTESNEPGRAERTATKPNQRSPEDVEQEDKLLQDAQEQVKELFPRRNMQGAAFTVFYDLMHAPWQDPDPESLQRLRTLARQKWGKDYKSRLKEAIESLREVAIQLFADYLRVHDRGAYLSGELLRVEIASGHEAIRISAFPGENIDTSSDMSREKANWKKGLQTIRQLPEEWSQMFPGQDVPPIEIVACRPPANFDVRQFQFLRECAKAPRQVDSAARKRYEEIKKQWLSCKSRGLPLSGIGRLVDGIKDDTRAYMIHDLLELTQPKRLVIDYLPHRHRQAEALGWANTSTSTLRRASCFSDVAKACAAYTQSNRLDILDLGPCLPMGQRNSETSRGEMSFAFSKTRVGILRIALDECTDSRQRDGVSEVECLAATLCDRNTGMLSMFTGDTPAWLVLHVGNAKQRVDFKDTVEGLLFARSTKSFRVKQLLAFMSRVCTTTEASSSSSRIWSDAEIRGIESSLDSSS